MAEPAIRRYMAGQTVSILGFWVQSVTLSLLAWQISRSAAVIGAVNFALFAPLGIVALVYGPRVQPHNAARLTQRALLAQAGVSGALLALTLVGWVSVPALVVLGAVSGLVSAAELPARQVLLASSVQDRQLIGSAVSLNTMAFNVAHILGPVIASALFAMLGAGPGFALAALASGFMVRQVGTLPTPPRPDADVAAAGPGRHGLREALAYVAGNAHARLFLPVVASLAVLGASYRTVVPVLADRDYHDVTRYTGLFFGAAGAGSLLAAVVMSSRHGGVAARWLQAVLPWCVAAGMGLLALTAVPAVAVACFAVLGFGLTFVGPGTNAILQQHAPPHLRGALVGLYVMSFVGSMPLGHLMAGLLAQWLSARQTLGLMAVLLVLCLASLFGPRWWRLRAIVLDSDRL